jgi:hypothetical protein
MIIMKKNHTKISLVIILILMTVMIFETECGSNRKFVLTDAVRNCSFDYPSSYPKPGVRREDGFTGIYAKRILTQPLSIHTFIIEVMEKDEVNTDSQVLLERDLNYNLEYQRPNEFKLMDRSSITVSGVPGEQISYIYYSWTEYRDKEGKYMRVPNSTYNAYFEYDGVLWRISVNYHQDMSDIVKSDFELIIRTFKLLN